MHGIFLGYGEVFVMKSDITKTYLYNFYPLKPHFYIVKLGFTGVYIIFLISAQNIDCGYSLEPPRRVPTIYVLSRNMENIGVFYMKVSVFGDEIFYIFAIAYFRNESGISVEMPLQFIYIRIEQILK